MPHVDLFRIKRVVIYYSHLVDGFQFFDKNNTPLLLGDEFDEMTIGLHGKTETVVLEDNEIIVGIVATKNHQSDEQFTDFQFQIAKMNKS